MRCKHSDANHVVDSICELAGTGTVEKQVDWLPDVTQRRENKKCSQRQSRHSNCMELYQMRKETLKRSGGALVKIQNACAVLTIKSLQ